MNRRRYGFGAGTISLITVLVALFLCLLCALALSDAETAARYDQTAVQKNEDYLAADTEAQERYAAVDAAVRAGTPLPEGCTREGDTVVFEIPAGERLLLSVRLALRPEGCVVDRWELIPAEPWEPEGAGHELWTGEE